MFKKNISKKKSKELNKYLEQFGTDFNSMRAWLKNKHNIK